MFNEIGIRNEMKYVKQYYDNDMSWLFLYDKFPLASEGLMLGQRRYMREVCLQKREE